MAIKLYKHKSRKAKRTHGFLERAARGKKGGSKVLLKRRRKQRSVLSA